ncbi:MAG: LysR family transcriptional regulator [Cyclobacteriaceae bacterium]
MELRHLKLLEAVAEEGNLTKVVDRLHVSSSALSHQLREIERELGLPLFHRVNKRLILTDAGRVLLKSAKSVLRELDKAELDLRHLKEGSSGEIRISTECYTCYHWLPGVAKSFSETYPNVDISIHPEYTDSTVAPLLSGKVDAVITSYPEDNPAIEYRELFRDEQLAVVAEDHPWAKKSHVDPEDFISENVIIYCGPLETVSLFSQLLIPKGISPKKVTELQLTEAQIEMVKAGFGVKVIAKWAVEPYLKSQPIVALPVTEKGLHRTWYLALLKQDAHPDYYECFIESLSNQMRNVKEE